ncbi:UNVERIFIED_CONTAM: protein ACCELERATED CELL DEATH 6 [Sesamum calycinum]|uniref:Protein ACCELERATED CELL DEATH 6 n=1 Tax=Sesamum calycinum TaxID=2727403 RepID=A0AAW2MAH4_9LAMI
MGRLDLMIELEHGPQWQDDRPKKKRKKDQREDPRHLHDFLTVLDQVSAAEHASYADILRRVSPAGNTYIHVAAKHGNQEIVTHIAAMDPSLVLRKNSDGDTPLHLAAKAGQESVVRSLLLIHSQAENLLRARNERGNTALHEALINGHESIAEYLVREDPVVSCYENDEGKSVLYLAAEYGYADCVLLILQLSPESMVEQFKEKSPIHAAIKGKNRDVLEAMLNMNTNLVQLRDAKGRNPLHYAVSLGYLEGVRYLLDKCAPSATQRDNSGSFPIHLASINSSVEIISLLLQDCPCPEELLDGTDKDGNPPLHLASKEGHPRIVNVLTWDKRVDVKIVNHEGMTALDFAEYYMKYNSQFRQPLTWAALKAAGTPRSLCRTTTGGQNSKKSSNMENYKDRVNTLLLVSTLVATVTFAAGFTLPGGYNTSDGDLGIAAMLREKGFHIFVFCDTIAMFSSILVAVTLIWAQLGDLTLVLNALTLAVPLLGIALTMMAMAFTAGVFLAVSKLRWLSTAVLVMGITFFTILFVLLLPLCTPLTSTNQILRHISYYSFYLLILATRN